MKNYVSLEEGNKKLLTAINVASSFGHELWIKNYDEGYEREEGVPDYQSFNHDEIVENGVFNATAMPKYEGDGCNDIVVIVKEGAETTEYHLMYSDDEEDRVYIDEIEDYLSQYGPDSTAFKMRLAKLYNGSDWDALQFMYSFCDNEWKTLCERILHLNNETTCGWGEKLATSEEQDEYYKGKWKLLEHFGISNYNGDAVEN